MNQDAIGQGLSRRDFTKAAAAGAAGLTVGLSMSSPGAEAEKTTEAPKAETQGGAKIPSRDLGKTGLKVSEISLGAMDVRDAAVVSKAIDAGCTYIDTAAGYDEGQNEVMVGTIMAKRRKEVVLATKFAPSSKNEIFASVDRSLKSLQTDVIDVIQVHNMRDGQAVRNPEFKDAFDVMKKQGKVRFLGFTTHGNQVEVINACIELGYVDAMLIGLSASDPPAVADAVERARKAGIGTVIMKSMKGARTFKNTGSKLTPHQMAARWVLDKPYVDTVNIGMVSFAHVDEDVKASQLALSALDRINLERYAAAACTTCSMCGACAKCPNGVEPLEILRAHMYAFSYGNIEKAREEFLAMGGPAMLRACGDCGQCEEKCPRRIKVREQFRQVAGLLA